MELATIWAVVESQLIGHVLYAFAANILQQNKYVVHALYMINKLIQLKILVFFPTAKIKKINPI
jgi:hypothetical protein